MVRRERDVDREWLAHRLAVVPALGDREHLAVRVDDVRDRVEDPRTIGDGRLGPRVLGGVGGVERQFDILYC